MLATTCIYNQAMLPPDFPIQAVLFDYGMVLSLPRNPRVWSELAHRSGLSETDLEHAYWQRREEYDAGALTGENFWSGIGATAGVTYSAEQLMELNAGDVRLWGDVNEPMLAWVEQLHGAGIRTGILSNMGDRMAEGLMTRFDWIGRFPVRIWSHELGVIKPSASIYRAAADGLGVDPVRILFIDDKAENVRGAEAVGMQAILYNGHEAFVQTMKDRGYDPLLQPSLSPGHRV